MIRLIFLQITLCTTVQQRQSFTSRYLNQTSEEKYRISQHKNTLHKQQKVLMLEYPNMKDAKKKQKAQTDKKSKDEDFREGGPIYSRTTSDKKDR